MKKWNAPMAVVEQFMSNEYIAACGDVGGETIISYLFSCDAGFTPEYDVEGNVTGGKPSKKQYEGLIYLENGAQSGLQVEGVNADTQYHRYHCCGAAHESATPGAYSEGYFLPWVGGSNYDENMAYPVFVWKGESGDSCHCTARLGNVTTPWYTSKS